MIRSISALALSSHNSIKWRVYHRPPRKVSASHGVHLAPKLPASHVGFVHAGDKAAALARATLIFDQRPIEVIAESAWSLLSRTERDVFTGTFTPPPECVGAKSGDPPCIACGLLVPQPKREAGGRSGRPSRYHDECRPPGIRQQYEKRLAARLARVSA